MREVELAMAGAAALARVRGALGPLRSPRRGGRNGAGRGAESWDDPIREALATVPTEPEALARWRAACAAWEEAEEIWWELAQYRTSDMVYHTARRMLPIGRGRYQLGDMLQAGLLGAYRAAQGWEPGNKAAWRTYAGRGIEQHVRLHLRKGATEYVHLSSPARTWAWRIARIRHELEKEGVSLSAADAAELAEVPAHRQAEVVQGNGLSNIVHLDAMRTMFHRSGMPDGETDHHETIPGESPDWDEQIEHQQNLDALYAAIEHLPENLQRVLMGRLKGLKLREIGKSLGVTIERARQLETKALAKLFERFGKPAPLGSPFSQQTDSNRKPAKGPGRKAREAS